MPLTLYLFVMAPLKLVAAFRPAAPISGGAVLSMVREFNDNRAAARPDPDPAPALARGSASSSSAGGGSMGHSGTWAESLGDPEDPLQGLTSEEADRRLQRWGRNEIPEDVSE